MERVPDDAELGVRVDPVVGLAFPPPWIRVVAFSTGGRGTSNMLFALNSTFATAKLPDPDPFRKQRHSTYMSVSSM